MYYNFVRIHKTLRVTPAMGAGVADKLWEIGDIVALIEAKEAEASSTESGTRRSHVHACFAKPLEPQFTVFGQRAHACTIAGECRNIETCRRLA